MPVIFLSSKAQPMESCLEEMLLLGFDTWEGAKPFLLIIAAASTLSSGLLRRCVKSIIRKWLAASSQSGAWNRFDLHQKRHESQESGGLLQATFHKANRHRHYFLGNHTSISLGRHPFRNKREMMPAFDRHCPGKRMSDSFVCQESMTSRILQLESSAVDIETCMETYC